MQRAVHHQRPHSNLGSRLRSQCMLECSQQPVHARVQPAARACSSASLEPVHAPVEPAASVLSTAALCRPHFRQSMSEPSILCPKP
eukprot:366008-Chlamydomonas_euryale.AAC.14